MSWVTSTEDVQVDILLQLPLDDLREFCYTNNNVNDMCHHHTRIKNKIHHISAQVLEILKNAENVGSILYPTISYENLIVLMKRYNIHISRHKLSDINTITSILIMEPSCNQYMIIIKMMSGRANTELISRHDIKEFLFHLIYDQYV